ncbi:DUF4064 domain-containing protein [Aureivirga marina]|uniref:DUF4064 domain-containing protein n=1 Tax=Aureivirga marina TaxID=1182451 RepID=UPI0018C9BCBA|nr:DUF4064 domain-containing protein [Aureivirga marina]
MTEKGTSSAPMILGIIGGVLGIPSALCAGACGTAVGAMANSQEQINELERVGNLGENLTDEDIENLTTVLSDPAPYEAAATTGSIFIWIGIAAAILGLVGGIMGKPKPTIAGILMILSAVLVGTSIIVGNLLSIVVAIIFLIGGIMCFVQKKEEITLNA